ncbi:hypothetical protein BKA65DRAFT_547708 [Rhexocercosporidium sp. MPI-PUGE-AT-0058]|nr:hypothetical protein BKA65DRAFT_547708 [Rhexocercosporidium sp. MPI-PUGE-AT-0058]
MQVRQAVIISCLVAPCVQTAGVNLTDLIQQVPLCAIGCISQRVLDLPPTQTDPNSVCRNETMEAAAASCVLSQCNYDDQNLVADVKAKFCEGVPIQSRAWDVAIIGLVFGPIALMAVALRCYSQYSKIRRLGSDDWLALAAGLTLIPYVVIDIYNGLINGYGRHYWDLDPTKIENLLKVFYVSELLYIVALTLVKASILVFYLRVFTPRWFVIVDLMTLCVAVLAGLAIMFCLIFQCSPISGVWDRTQSTQCLDVNTLSYLSAAISVVLDVVILILPIPVLIRLKMSFKEKLSLIMMFSLGSLACITSGIRLKYLVAFATSKDPTYLPLTGDNALPAIWSFIEICVALICACLPAMRALLSHWFPSIFNLTSPSTVNLKGLTPARTPDPEVSHPFHSLPKEKVSAAFIEKVGPSYNKRVIPRAPSHEHTQASNRSSDIFPNGLSYHFSSQFPALYQSRGRKDSDTYATPQRVAIPQTLSAQIESHSHPNSETKIWINPRFDSEGNLVEFQGAPPPSLEHAELRYSLPTKEGAGEAGKGGEACAEEEGEEESTAEERRVSRALCLAEEGVVVKPAGVALPMRKQKRNGRLQKGGFQRLLTPIPPEMGPGRL